MSRRLLIGFIAALAVLVSAGPALAGAPSHNGAPSSNGACTAGQQGFILTSIGAVGVKGTNGVFAGHYGDGKLAGFACLDGVASKALAGAKPLSFDRGYLGVGLKAAHGASIVVWDPNCPSGCSYSSKTLPAWDGLVWWPVSGLVVMPDPGFFAKVIDAEGSHRGFTSRTLPAVDGLYL